MANGWARDGAVQEQIHDTVKDAISAARAWMPAGIGADECDDATRPIAMNGRSGHANNRFGNSHFPSDEESGQCSDFEK